jgi:hypothetical protein
MDIDPQKHLRRMWESAPLLAKAKAERVYIEQFRSTLKAQLMAESDAKTVADREVYAYSHDAYKANLEGLRAAIEAEELLRWRMVTDQATVEVWRSLEASNRGMDRGTR